MGTNIQQEHNLNSCIKVEKEHSKHSKYIHMYVCEHTCLCFFNSPLLTYIAWSLLTGEGGRERERATVERGKLQPAEQI